MMLLLTTIAGPELVTGVGAVADAAAVAAATADSSRFLSLLRTKRTVRNLEPLLPTILRLSLSVPMQLKRALVCSMVPAAGAFGYDTTPPNVTVLAEHMSVASMLEREENTTMLGNMCCNNIMMVIIIIGVLDTR